MLAITLTGLLQQPKTPRVEKVENAGLLFTDNTVGVSGMDCGYSLPIGKQTLWFCGDVFLLHPTDPAKPYVGGVSNGALLVPAGQGMAPLRRYKFLTDTKTGLARPVIPNEAGEGSETRLWPFGGWYDAAHQRAYLYYGLVRTTGGGGPFDFKVVGQGLARANAAKPLELRFDRVKGIQPDGLWWQGGQTLFGSAVVTGVPENDPYLYIVGYEERQGKKFGKLARVRKENIEQQTAYEVFSGTGETPAWNQTLSEASDIVGLTDFPSELSVAYNWYLGGYLAVYSIGVEPRLRLSLAPQPWGPYRTIAEIGAPHQAFARAFCYAGKEHPELAEQNGRVLYVTYVDNQRYWLQMLKITLTK